MMKSPSGDPLDLEAHTVLVVIPARGGSKGVPRKNTRPLHGKPLVVHVLETIKKSAFRPLICVSSDDEEILGIAEAVGVGGHLRASTSSTDDATLDAPVFEATQFMEGYAHEPISIVATVQPTSPLLKRDTFDRALAYMVHNPQVDSVISAVEDTHLRWGKNSDGFLPKYAKRLNRQYLPKEYRETGAFLITRREFVTPESRLGKRVELMDVPVDEAIDIDSHHDFALCEYLIRRKRILFVVSGYPEIGLGHVYNSMLLAHQLIDHDVRFLVDQRSDLAFQKIAESNYPVTKQVAESILQDIARHKPDLVVNDRLSTTREYMQGIQQLGARTVNFEDLGEGAMHADLVFNAIYPERESLPNHYFGPRYFCLRDEFVSAQQQEIQEHVRHVLIAFGGVDPNNLTHKVIKAIADECDRRSIEIHVVAGFGYQQHESLRDFCAVSVHRNVANISQYMSRADVAFTSAGRTTFELASLGVPTIVMAQNTRELTHLFATAENGFANLGLGTEVSRSEILQAFKQLIDSRHQRTHMSQSMTKVDVKGGKEIVLELIRELIKQ